MSEELVRRIRAGLAGNADPDRAAGMQAYLKSELPCYGVRLPDVRRVTGRALRDQPPADREQWEEIVRVLFDGATHREERFAALAVARHASAREFWVPQSLPLYEHLAVAGAWWDLVDEISRRVGDVLLGHRDSAEPVIRRWAQHPDRWLRRSAIICQLGHRRRTDTTLLTDVIDANTDDPDFFCRKAIGWALRDYAKTDPDWVRRFVAEREQRMAPLSRREALKHL